MSVNTLCWTDIPVNDLDRATKFYSAVLGQEVSKMSEGGFEYGLLPHEEQNASGCLCVGADSVGSKNTPSQTGPLVYLSVEGRLDDAIKPVRANSGKVLEEKTQIGPHCFRAVIVDSATALRCIHRRNRPVTGTAENPRSLSWQPALPSTLRETISGRRNEAK